MAWLTIARIEGTSSMVAFLIISAIYSKIGLKIDFLFCKDRHLEEISELEDCFLEQTIKFNHYHLTIPKC